MIPTLPGVWHAGETELRVLDPDEPDFARLVGDITTAAYPVMNVAPSERDAFVAKMRGIVREDPSRRLAGAYRAGELAGGMQLYDFEMRVRGMECATGGLGMVAVGFAHKRRGVARDIVAGFLARYASAGTPLAALYPFRPSFYRTLGFGYGTKIDQYRIAPDALRRHGERAGMRRLAADDAPAALAAYERMQARTNGLMRRSLVSMRRTIEEPAYVTYGTGDDRLRGYVIFSVALGPPGTQNTNELQVVELVYDDPDALAALLAFLRAQGDQFATIVLNTQEPDLHVAFDDPRNGSNRSLAAPAWHETNAQGVGIMYRLVDLPALVRALSQVRFGSLDLRLRVRLTDQLLAANDGAHVLAFERGTLSLADTDGAEAELSIGVADFSSLVMGSLRLASLVRYGRAALAPLERLADIDAAFATDPPQCKTRF